MAGVTRWVFRDPYTAETWTVPMNPKEMSSLFPQKSVSVNHTTAIDGQTLLFEGSPKVADWQFSGDILDAAHHENLRKWVYDKNNRVIITDHFGRQITVYLTAFEATPKRAVNKYWRHTYTIKGLVLNVTAPTVGL